MIGTYPSPFLSNSRQQILAIFKLSLSLCMFGFVS
jgi:hypothetical protein